MSSAVIIFTTEYTRSVVIRNSTTALMKCPFSVSPIASAKRTKVPHPKRMRKIMSPIFLERSGMLSFCFAAAVIFFIFSRNCISAMCITATKNIEKRVSSSTLDNFLLLRTPPRHLLATTVGLALHRRKFGCSPPYIYTLSLCDNRVFFCVFQI